MYFILFVSIAISLVTIFYYVRVIAYLFIGDDTQTRCAAPVVDVVSFNNIALFQGCATAMLIF